MFVELSMDVVDSLKLSLTELSCGFKKSAVSYLTKIFGLRSGFNTGS